MQSKAKLFQLGAEILCIIIKLSIMDLVLLLVSGNIIMLQVYVKPWLIYIEFKMKGVFPYYA